MAHLPDFFVVLIVWLQGTLLVNGNQDNPDIPKIYLLENIEPVRKSISINSNTNTNSFTETHTKTLKLSCVSDSPNVWKWMYVDNRNRKIITKERRQQTNSSKNAYYVSNLTVIMDSDDDTMETNFSCVSVLDTTTSINWSNKLGACAQMLALGKQPKKFHVFDRVSIKDCLSSKENENAAVKDCPRDLTVDLDGRTGSCRKQQEYNTSISLIRCNDLDTCENFHSEYFRSHDTNGTIPCVQTKGNFGYISPNVSNYDDIMTLHSQTLTPVLVVCETSFDNHWTSFLPLYTSAHILGISWDNLTDYKTLEDARHQNSVQLVALPYGQDKFDPTLRNQHKKDTFAVGETVTFACVAVKYLFMLGFQWTINGRPLYQNKTDKTEAGSDFSTEYLHVNSKTILMNATKYGNSFQVSCHAPIWNSVDFISSTKNISLFSAKKPRTQLNCNETDEMVNCSCVYSGWPRPVVSWKESLDDDTNNGSNISSHMLWTSYRAYVKPSYTSPRQTVIACEAINFRGRHGSKYEKGKVSSDRFSSARTTSVTKMSFVLVVFIAAMDL